MVGLSFVPSLTQSKPGLRVTLRLACRFTQADLLSMAQRQELLDNPNTNKTYMHHLKRFKVS